MDKGHESCDLKQVVVSPIGDLFGEAGGIRCHDAATKVCIQIADLIGEHRAAVVEAFVRPPPTRL